MLAQTARRGLSLFAPRSVLGGAFQASASFSSSPPSDDSHDDFKPKVKANVSPVHDQIEKDIKSNKVRMGLGYIYS